MTDESRDRRRAIIVGVLIVLAVTTQSSRAQSDAEEGDGNSRMRHVLLISVDGMHQIDLQRYLAGHPHSAFARLAQHGVQYTQASTSLPSDSFPGLLAFMTGGSR